MKYFFKTKFLEGTQKKLIGKSKPTIDLISIGIVAEDRPLMKSPYKDVNGNDILEGMYIKGLDKHVGESNVFFDYGRWQPFDYLDDYEGSHYEITNTPRELTCVEKGKEYYAISKDFNLKAAWENEWVRENVLIPLVIEVEFNNTNRELVRRMVTINTCKSIINKYGKTNKQISEEIRDFVYKGNECSKDVTKWGKEIQHEFYGYYSDYDWVVFCWLFGRMIDLPIGFPQYCRDLKQIIDEKVMKIYISDGKQVQSQIDGLDNRIEWLRTLPHYPKIIDEHNALSDARFNKQLYEFLNTL